ncbi:amidase [Nemania sp. FL0031]|nr:amidase [Nemania sp. FL0031]
MMLRESSSMVLAVGTGNAPVGQELVLDVDGLEYLLVENGSDFGFASLEHCSIINSKNTHEHPQVFTVFPLSHVSKITVNSLQAFRSNHLDPDDIFCPAFLNHIVFNGCQEGVASLDQSVTSFLESWRTHSWCFVQEPSQADNLLAPGPYVSYRGKIWEPWRVYYDDNLALVTSLRPAISENNKRTPVELDSYLNTNRTRVVVPSRCYTSATNSADQPLAGVRIVVKDIFDIKGLKTSLCNRAWCEYYAPKAETAPCIAHLQELGAIIVGKARLNAMVVREEPMECVEFLAPFNPRGDGYQTPSGSSSGSCVALAAYPWIDFALGSDTNGSCRKPAYWMACFAIRPTTGVLQTRGVASFCPFFDVPTFFGRDFSRFREFASLWYGNSPMLLKDPLPPSEKASRILYPLDYLPTPNNSQMELIESFVRGLEQTLGIQRTRITISEMWHKSGPDLDKDIDLPDYLATVSPHSDARCACTLTTKAATLPYYKDAVDILNGFSSGYKEKFGKAPFFHRALRWRWDIADKVTKEEHDEGWERIYKYREWLRTNIFRPGTLMVLPVDEGKPNNRETPPPPFTLLSGYHPLYLSPIAGTPEVTAPIGEIPYYSDVTQREEPLAVSVSVVSCPGTDLHLIDCVYQALVEGKKPVKVATGRSIFDK